MTGGRPKRARLARGLLALLALGPGCAHRLDGDPFSAKKALTRELVARREWAGAFAYADELHRTRPEDPDVLVLRGVVFRERGLLGEAEADFRAALALDGGLAEAHAALAITLDLARRGSEAEGHHLRAVELDPKNPAYLNNLGFSLYLAGRSQEAVKVYLQAARLGPTARRVRNNLGFAWAALGEMRRAARELSLGGTPAEAKNNLGFVYEQRGDLARAYDLYLEAARMDPRSRRARRNLLHAAKSLGKDVPDLPKEEP